MERVWNAGCCQEGEALVGCCCWGECLGQLEDDRQTLDAWEMQEEQQY